MQTKRIKMWIILFILPSVIIYTMVFAVPLISVITTSLTDWAWINPPKFSGLKNYIFLFTSDKTFIASFLNTLKWILIACTLHLGYGILVAIVLSKKPFGWKIIRTLFLLPNIISAAALAIMFKQLFNPGIGLLNSFIRLLGFKDFNQNWLGDSGTAFYAVTSMWVFYAAVITLLIMSEISSIPDSVFESAKVDGASGLEIDFFITLPLLRNIIGTSCILAATGMLTQFETMFLTTGGGPGDSTMNLSLYLYKTFNMANNYGLANAIGTIQIILGITIVLSITKAFQIGRSDI